jgi:hypothetical protein
MEKLKSQFEQQCEIFEIQINESEEWKEKYEFINEKH